MLDCWVSSGNRVYTRTLPGLIFPERGIEKVDREGGSALGQILIPLVFTLAIDRPSIPLAGFSVNAVYAQPF